MPVPPKAARGEGAGSVPARHNAQTREIFTDVITGENENAGYLLNCGRSC